MAVGGALKVHGRPNHRASSEKRFADKCTRTCELCAPKNAMVGACVDHYSAFTCTRYEKWGWCAREDTKEATRLQCPVTCGVCKGYTQAQMNEEQAYERSEEHTSELQSP